MIRKRLEVILLVIICCLGNMSCQKPSDKMISDINEFPETYKRVSDSIKIELDIIIDETAEAFLYNSKARRIKINEEKIVKDLLYKNSLQKEVEKIDKWLYKNTKGATLTIIKDTAIYMSNSENYEEVQMELEEKFSKKLIGNMQDSTDFLSNKIKLDNQLKSWGIKNFSLENRAYSENLEVKSSAWCGYERWQGIRVFSNKFSRGLSEEAAPLQITEISDSIEKLQLLYGYEFKKSKELLKLQSFDKVADSIEEEYSMLLTNKKYEAVAAQLAFWVKDVHDQEELDMEPVWVITIRERKEDKSSDYIEYEETYSALTAQNIG